VSIGVAALVTAMLSAALWFVLITTQGWAEQARPATCLATHCFCEAPHDGALVQPANTVSSLAYLALGAWALSRWARAPGTPGGSSRVLVPGVALATCAIGLSSAYYHATLTFLGQYFDVMSMYLLGALLVCGALWRRGTLGERGALLLFLAMALALGVAQYVEPELRRVLFAVVLVPGIALEHTAAVHGAGRDRNDLVPLRVGVGLLVIAYGFWLADQFRVLCWPDSWFQGHAVWPVLTAIAAVLLVAHYARTPRPVVSPPPPSPAGPVPWTGRDTP
jgi:hypothetical protein